MMKRWMLLCAVVMMTMGLRAQVILNEVQADAGNNDGNGGDWIELKNVGTNPVDLSCWRLTNGVSVLVTIPGGLILPAGDYLIIGNASKMMCATCDFKSMNSLFTLNASGFGTGTGAYANTMFLNTDLVVNGGCGCLDGNGNLNNGSGSGDRIVLFDQSGAIADAMMYAGGDYYGSGPINVNFAGLGTCPVTSLIVPAVTDLVFNGRIICNDLSGCNSSYARLPDGNNGANVTYDQSGNLLCTNCLAPCAAGATNTGSTDFPTPGRSNSLSSNTWSATLNGLPISSPTTTITVCGGSPLTFMYSVQRYANAALVSTQASGNFGSYVSINGGAPVNFGGTNYNTASGTTTLAHTFTPPGGTTTYEFVWGDGNVNCSSCPGGTSLSNPSNPNSLDKECYVTRTLTVSREDLLGGSPVASCTIPGTITVNGASGTNLRYTLQKQTSTGGPFVTILGPQVSNIIGGIIDDDADPNLPNYRVLVSTNNTVCANPTPLTVLVPNACLGNPACARYATTGSGVPTFSPATGSTVCAGSPVQFNVNITGVCTSGQIEVLYDFDPLFDPYLQGTLLGSVTPVVGSTPPVTTATGKVFINEFVVRPAQGTCSGTPDGLNPNSGEWVELYNAGPGFVDISGWILADGDWTATIPAGTVMNAGAHYLIGGGGTFCSSGVMPDLNIETCNCATVSPATADIMNLTNGGEQLALFDCSGTFIDGVLWASGQGLPDNTDNNAPATGCGDYIIAKSVNLPAASSFASSGTIPSPNAGKYRTGTNTWTTTTATTITPKASNPGGNWSGTTTPFGTQCPPPAVSASITVNLPDTCAQTGATPITVKAIYKPTPVSPCTESEVTASATFSIPSCETLSLSGSGDYCAPATAPVNISSSGLLIGNHTIYISNGTDTVAVSPATGAGPFAANLPSTGTWTIVSTTPPIGTCPPKAQGNAQVSINQIPVITASPSAASFCYQYGFDLSSIESSISTTPSSNSFSWYDTPVGGTAIGSFVNPFTPTTYYVAANSGFPSFCEGSVRTPVLLDINPLPEVPNISCNGVTATFTPQSPNCQPTPCASALEYSANGINWSTGPTFTNADPGWAGFGSPFNSLVYIRPSATPSCFMYVTYFSPCAAPLPAQLFHFTGHLNTAGNTELQWKTAQEQHVSHFDIEKRTDYTGFSKISSVKAKGNTSEITSYSGIDPQPYHGNNYYRLKIVDENGEYAYSNVVVVNKDADQTEILALYPNPAMDQIRLDMQMVKDERTTVQVIDALGHTVIETPLVLKSGFQQHTIPVQALAAGRYVLRISLSTQTLIKPFVKE